MDSDRELHNLPDGFIRWAIGPARERVEVNLRLWDAWILLSSVQLTICHPDVRGRQLEAQLRVVGKRLEVLIQAYAPPDVAAIAAAGWIREGKTPADVGQVGDVGRGGDWGQLANIGEIGPPVEVRTHRASGAELRELLAAAWGEAVADRWMENYPVAEPDASEAPIP
jgi:hypothetical protein